MMNEIYDDWYNDRIDKMHRLEKAFGLLQNTITTAEAIVKAIRAIPRYKLPRIAKAARKRKALSVAQVVLTAAFGAAQHSVIVSQPLPKYKSGTHE